MSVDLIRTPVSVSMRVRNSRLPSESRPYSDSGRSGSIDRRRIRLICSEISRRSRAGHSSRGSSCSSARNLLVPAASWPHRLERLGELAGLRERRQPRRAGDRRVAAVGPVVAQQRVERVARRPRARSPCRPLRPGLACPICAHAPQAIAVRGQRPGHGASGRRRPASCWRPRRRPGPASPPARRPTRTSRTSPAVRRCRGLVQIPRAVHLGAQSRSISSSVMLASVASSITAAACSTPRKRKPGRGRRRPPAARRSAGSAMSPSLDLDLDAAGTDALDDSLAPAARGRNDR